MRKKRKRYDFKAFGQAIKDERKKLKMTREQVGIQTNIDSRYLTNIENKGQTPSLSVFHELVAFFKISVDQFFYPNSKPSKSAKRRRLEAMLDSLNDTDLIILEATAKGIVEAKEINSAF